MSQPRPSTTPHLEAPGSLSPEFRRRTLERLRSTSQGRPLDVLVIGAGPADADRDPSKVGESQVSRADVARVIAAVVEREDLAERMIEFVNGPTPIDEALDAAAR